MSARGSSWPPDDPEIRAALLTAWESQDWGRYEGRFTAELAQALAEWHQVEFAYLCASGTFAVELALRGLGVQAGDEVVLAGYDFPGNFRAIEAVGGRPVLVDLEPGQWSLDPGHLRAALTSGPVRACIVSHLHGTLANMTEICQLAAEFGVGVVEDACQASGATVQGRPAGTWGDVGVLSFGGSKLLTAGRGGALLTQDAGIVQRAKIFCERGNHAFPLSELQAAVLLPQLKLLERRHAERAAHAAAWRARLSDPAGPLWHPQGERGSPAYYKLGLWLADFLPDDRERWAKQLGELGLDVGPGFRGFFRRGSSRCRRVGDLPRSARAAERTLVVHHTAFLGPVSAHPARIETLLRAVAGSPPGPFQPSPD